MTATIHHLPRLGPQVWVAAESDTLPDGGFVITADGVVAATYGRSWDLEWSWHHDDGAGETPESAVLAIADDEDAAWAWLQGWLISAQGYTDAEAAEFVAFERGSAKAAVRTMFERSLAVR